MTISRPPRVAVPALAGLALAGIWVMLVLVRPTTTWHLAPLLIVLAPPWAAANRDDMRRGLWLVAGVGLALATTGGLHAMTLLRGPALIGSDATVEAAIAITAGASSDSRCTDHPTVQNPRSG